MEHEQIVLTADVLGDDGKELKPGDVGTIIHVHPDQEAFVVEFMSLDGGTVAIATVLPSRMPERLRRLSKRHAAEKHPWRSFHQR